MAYYDAAKVEEIGQPVTHCSRNHPHVPSDKHLIAITGNGLWKIAGDVTRAADYRERYDAYSQGHWLYIRLYLLTEKQLEECPDRGRVPDSR